MDHDSYNAAKGILIGILLGLAMWLLALSAFAETITINTETTRCYSWPMDEPPEPWTRVTWVDRDDMSGKRLQPAWSLKCKCETCDPIIEFVLREYWYR